MRFMRCFSVVLSVLMGARLLPVVPQASSIFVRQQRFLPLQTSAFLPLQALIQKVIPSYRNFSTSQFRAMAAEDKGKNIVVYVTVPNKEAGKDLAHSIVNAKLAACVNQVPGGLQIDQRHTFKACQVILKGSLLQVNNESNSAEIVTSLGIESTYWWEGKVETDTEVLLVIKTRESLLKDLTTHVIKNHKYEVPEVIAMPIIGGNPKYLKWLEDSTKV